MSAERAVVQYDVYLDSERTINLFENQPTLEQINSHEGYILRQLRTDLGERLDLSESTYQYEIRDGKLFADNSSEPFEETILRGIWDHRLRGSPQDWEREDAELASFRLTQELLADPNTPDGTTVLEISPRGQSDNSIYVKNVFEFKTKVNSSTVMVTRYLSNLSNEEYRKKVIEINPNYSALLSDKPTDVDFKGMPIVLPPYFGLKDHESLALYFLQDKVGIDKEEFDRLTEIGNNLDSLYVFTLINEPENIQKLKAIRDKRLRITMMERFASVGIFYSERDVPVPGGACGPGSCSVAEFGKPTDKYGPREFLCPDCNEKNLRPEDVLISNCQKCGSSKVLPPGMS